MRKGGSWSECQCVIERVYVIVLMSKRLYKGNIIEWHDSKNQEQSIIDLVRPTIDSIWLRKRNYQWSLSKSSKKDREFVGLEEKSVFAKVQMVELCLNDPLSRIDHLISL